ncbi:hypothetical protein LCGC14_3148540, partial [marine sediment metagenome]
TPHDIKVLKKDMTASDFIETDEYKKILRGNINFHSVNAPKLKGMIPVNTPITLFPIVGDVIAVC